MLQSPLSEFVSPLRGGYYRFTRAVLNGKKKVFRYTVSPKKPTGTPCVGGGRLAVGGWRLAVGGSWWWLAAVGGWGLVVDGGWQWLAVGRRRRLAVGGCWRLAVGGCWWLAVDDPLGRSLRAVLNKKNFSSLRTPCNSPAFTCIPRGSGGGEVRSRGGGRKANGWGVGGVGELGRQIKKDRATDRGETRTIFRIVAASTVSRHEIGKDVGVREGAGGDIVVENEGAGDREVDPTRGRDVVDFREFGVAIQEAKVGAVWH